MKVVRIIPDVKGLDRAFDYLVPEHFENSIRLGSLVRIPFSGRRVGGWVIEENAIPPEGVKLLEIKAVRGYGPDQELIDLAHWATWRWAGKLSFFLQTASPLNAVKSLSAPSVASNQVTDSNPSIPSSVILQTGPAQSVANIIFDAASEGPILVIAPSYKMANSIVERMNAEGHKALRHPYRWDTAAAGGISVVGTMSAVWARMPEISKIIVIDSHDSGLISQMAPTWSAVEVASERAHRRGIQCLLISSVPRVEQSYDRQIIPTSKQKIREGWAPLHVVDLHKEDPHKGMYSKALVELLRSSDKRVVCVLNRKGRARLVSCSACNQLMNCEQCNGALSMSDDSLDCLRCKQSQPIVCSHCGTTKLKLLRVGVTRVREELEALAQRTVGEVVKETDELPEAEILVGTEALLHRVNKADAVVFLEFDQHLLAHKHSASEDALVLLAYASKIVGGAHRNGVVLAQTRIPDHETIDAAVYGDPLRLQNFELTRRKQLDWPPYKAFAVISGESAKKYVDQLGADVKVLASENEWLVIADDHKTLCDALKAVPRPPGKLRIEVDPVSL